MIVTTFNLILRTNQSGTVLDVVSVEQFKICFWLSERGLSRIDREEDTELLVGMKSFFVVVEARQNRNQNCLVEQNESNTKIKNHRLSSPSVVPGIRDDSTRSIHYPQFCMIFRIFMNFVCFEVKKLLGCCDPDPEHKLSLGVVVAFSFRLYIASTFEQQEKWLISTTGFFSFLFQLF